jgi:hypothetical protein
MRRSIRTDSERRYKREKEAVTDEEKLQHGLATSRQTALVIVVSDDK